MKLGTKRGSKRRVIAEQRIASPVSNVDRSVIEHTETVGLCGGNVAGLDPVAPIQGQPKRHPDYWFDDGNIVVIAGNISYRVHAGILSRPSDVLRKLCTEIRAGSIGDILGSPILTLQDAPEDVTALMSILYGGHSILKSNRSLTFSLVASLIRLGHKYDMKSILHDALKCLEAGCTVQFDLWKNPGWKNNLLTAMKDTDMITAVNLARLTNARSILPVALYGCIVLNDSFLLSGVLRDDGTHEKLSDDDLQLCIDGREKLREASRASRLWLLDGIQSISQTCQSTRSCANALHELGSKAFRAGKLSTHHVFDGLLHDSDVQLCAICRAMIMAKDLEGQRTIWSELPSLVLGDVSELQHSHHPDSVISDAETKGQTCDPVDSPHLSSSPASKTTLGVPPHPVGSTWHETYSFEDGNIVLISQNTMFRVHSSILTRKSNIFRSLMADRLNIEKKDGLPVLRLGAAAEEIADMLSVFYSGDQYFATAKGQNDEISFSLVASSVRLGHDYQIQSLREGGLSRLKLCFPTNRIGYRAGNWQKVRIKLGMKAEDVIVAVNLARLTETSSFLPFALYECCLLDGVHLIFGVKRADGSMGKLHPDDLKRCIQGRGKLLAANKDAVAWLFTESMSQAKNCKSSQACQRSLRTIQKNLCAAGKLDTFRALDPLMKGLTLDLCANCLRMVAEKDNKRRSMIWDNLSEYMGLIEAEATCTKPGAST